MHKTCFVSATESTWTAYDWKSKMCVRNYTLRIGLPRGGHARRADFEPEIDLNLCAPTKNVTRTRPKASQNGNLVNRYRKSRFCHCCSGEQICSVQFVNIFRRFRFWHPDREQSNTGNDKNERNLMHFRRSSDGVRFWQLQNRGPFFLCSFCGDFKFILA